MIRNLRCALLSFAFVVTVPFAAAAQQLVAEGETPGMKIEVRDIKRDDGGTVTLRFQLSNDSNADLDPVAFRADGDDWGVISGVHLIDAVNRKKYLVVRDSAKKCVCAKITAQVNAGQKLNLWAKFPAPPESIQKVSVVVPKFEPVENVPITPR